MKEKNTVKKEVKCLILIVFMWWNYVQFPLFLYNTFVLFYKENILSEKQNVQNFLGTFKYLRTVHLFAN